MKMPGLTLLLPEARPGQLLAFGVPLVLAMVFWFGVLRPVFGCYQSRAHEIAFKQGEISHLIAMRNLIPTLRRQLAASDAGPSAPLFLAGDTDAVAGANLQAALESLAGKSGASLSSTALLQGQFKDGLQEIAIDVDLTATWDVLIPFLSAIDLAHPRMIVSNLDITNAAQTEAIDENIPLQISFTVEAFRTGFTPHG